MLENKNLLNNLLDDSELEDVTGGVRGANNLPMHICGNGARGKLVPDGWIGSQRKYKCINCHKTGKISSLSGTNQYCELN